MARKTILTLDLIQSKIGYILACLSSYSSLDLSKRINDIHHFLFLINKSIKENKDYVDIRNVVTLRENYKELHESRLHNDDEVSLKGHKISCLLFEVSIEIKLLINESIVLNDEMKEYLEIASKYLYDCGRIVNNEILCFEEKY